MILAIQPTRRHNFIMFKDLITYTEVYECCSECFGFGDVTFKRDFGPWKQGQNIDNLWFQLDGEPTVKQFDKDGNIVFECKYTLSPC